MANKEVSSDCQFELLNSDSDSRVILTAPHAMPPKSDRNTGKLVQMVAEMTGTAALIGRVSRVRMDLNRSESDGQPFRSKLAELVAEKGRPLYIIDIHGSHKKAQEVEIGTAGGRTAPEWVVETIRKVALRHNFSVAVNEKLPGSRNGTIISTFSSIKDEVYAIQIELPQESRDLQNLGKTARLIAEIISKLR